MFETLLALIVTATVVTKGKIVEKRHDKFLKEMKAGKYAETTKDLAEMCTYKW